MSTPEAYELERRAKRIKQAVSTALDIERAVVAESGVKKPVVPIVTTPAADHAAVWHRVDIASRIYCALLAADK